MATLVVRYKSPKVEKICKSEKEARRKWGDEFVGPLTSRIGQLEAADSLGDLVGTGVPGKWEILTGDLAGQASAHLTKNWRLMMEVEGTDPSLITEVVVLGRGDYH